MFALSNLLFVYGFFVFLALLFFIFNIYHLVKFGLQSTKTTLVLGIYTLGFVFVLGGTLMMLWNIDWDQNIETGSIINRPGQIIEI